MVHQASSAPGTETEIAPRGAMTPLGERARTVSRVSDFGERPEPARLTTLESFGSQIIAKQSPPIPELVGSRKPRHALAAMAASIAEPPRLRVSIAVSVASGCAVPAAPEQPIAAERLAKLAPEGRSPAWTSGRRNFSSPAAWNFGRGWSCGSAALFCEF